MGTILKNLKQVQSIYYLLLIGVLLYSSEAYCKASLSELKTPTAVVESSLVTIGSILKAVTASQNEHILELHIYDLQGQLIMSFTGCNQSECTYDLSYLPSGMYKAIAFTNRQSFSASIYR